MDRPKDSRGRLRGPLEKPLHQTTDPGKDWLAIIELFSWLGGVADPSGRTTEPVATTAARDGLDDRVQHGEGYHDLGRWLGLGCRVGSLSPSLEQSSWTHGQGNVNPLYKNTYMT